MCGKNQKQNEQKIQQFIFSLPGLFEVVFLTIHGEEFLVQGGEFQVRCGSFKPGQRLHVKSGDFPRKCPHFENQRNVERVKNKLDWSHLRAGSLAARESATEMSPFKGVRCVRESSRRSARKTAWPSRWISNVPLNPIRSAFAQQIKTQMLGVNNFVFVSAERERKR